MQSKILGTSGEMRVAHEIYKRGYPCFAELGDTSRIDLIAIIGDRMIRIQVKTVTRVDGTYTIENRKSAKGYEYFYAVNDFDLFAVYCVDDDRVAWVPPDAFMVDGQRSQLRLRSLPTKNRQLKNVTLLEDFLDFNNALGL